MRHKDVIDLIAVTIAADSLGNQIEVQAERQVYANEFSLGYAEFYNAAQTGLRPSKAFEIYSWEYAAESKLKHNNVIYNIIRADTRGEKCRLVCERIAADHVAPFTAYLSALTIGTLALSPAFSPAIIAYQASTSNAADVVTAITFDPDATVSIELNGDPETNGTAFTWLAENEVVISVQNGTDTMVYTVTVSWTGGV